jgi:hypothetical protein
MGPDKVAVFIPITAIILGCAIPIVAIIVDHLSKKAKMRVIEKAVEKGLSLEGLSLEEKKGPRAPYRSGMVAMAVGIGIGISAYFFRETDLLGIASIPCLIGIALIINDRINYDRLFKNESDPR